MAIKYLLLHNMRYKCSYNCTKRLWDATRFRFTHCGVPDNDDFSTYSFCFLRTQCVSSCIRSCWEDLRPSNFCKDDFTGLNSYHNNSQRCHHPLDVSARPALLSMRANRSRISFRYHISDIIHKICALLWPWHLNMQDTLVGAVHSEGCPISSTISISHHVTQSSHRSFPSASRSPKSQNRQQAWTWNKSDCRLMCPV